MNIEFIWNMVLSEIYASTELQQMNCTTSLSDDALQCWHGMGMTQIITSQWQKL